MTPFLQIVITVWMHSHPVTFTLPKIFPTVDRECQRRIEEIFQRRIKGKHLEIECVPTGKRNV